MCPGAPSQTCRWLWRTAWRPWISSSEMILRRHRPGSDPGRRDFRAPWSHSCCLPEGRPTWRPRPNISHWLCALKQLYFYKCIHKLRQTTVASNNTTFGVFENTRYKLLKYRTCFKAIGFGTVLVWIVSLGR